MFGVVCPDQEGTQILMIVNTLQNDDYNAVNQISDLASLAVLFNFKWIEGLSQTPSVKPGYYRHTGLFGI